MKHRHFLFCGLFVTCAAACGVRNQPPVSVLPSEPLVGKVYTTRVGRVGVPPDLATVSIQFAARGATPRDAGADAARQVNVIRNALVAIGIPEDSMPTGGRWRSWGGRSQMSVSRDRRDTTYVTTSVFTVRIRDLDVVGVAIDTALAAGAQNISSVNFTRTEVRASRLEALRVATENARANAAAIAQAGGGTLGRLLELSTEPLPASMAQGGIRLRSVVVTNAAQSNQTTIVIPEVEVTVTVYGRWEVVGGTR